MSLPESAGVPHGEQTRCGGAAHAGAARTGEGSTA